MVDEHVKNSTEADLSNLLRVAGNDMNFVKEMILQFKESTQQGLKDIAAALSKENYEEVGNLAHKLVPACRHLGIISLVNQLKNIEENALNQNKKIILELLKTSDESLRKAEISLHNQFKKAKR